MVIALAGRRIDAPGTPPVFPLARVSVVRSAVAARLDSLGATVIVSSAACGADLLALDIARKTGRRRRIVLPFERSSFRESSVVDRPGDWGPLFDVMCDDAGRTGDLVVLGENPGTDDAYLAANERILDEALRLAGALGAAGVRVLVVWNGPRQHGVDATCSFVESASRRGVEWSEVRTLDD